MIKTVALVSRDNGVGLTTDMRLLDDMLTTAGYEVSWVDWRDATMPPVDVAIFLELWNHRLSRCAKHTVGIFNLEWFQRRWTIGLHACTQLWAKSGEAQQVFTRQLGLRNSIHTGFMSRDMCDPDVPRELAAVHLRGKSSLKGTGAVLEAWATNRDLPPLTVISDIPLDVPAGVRLLRRVDDAQLSRELNRAQIHVCPSETEGWGHYIAEGMSVGAIVVTTDASPMSEHITPDVGMLIRPVSTGRFQGGLATTWRVDAAGIAKAVRVVASMPAAHRSAMGARACARFHARNDAFQAKALQLLASM
jgi:glycosyltransferase involved in cell wall biosynthesis